MAKERVAVGKEPPHFSSLNAVLRAALAMLAEGAAGDDSPASLPALATIGAGFVPQVRTVVLRHFAEESRVLTVHTDTRSGKITDFKTSPNAALHIFDARKSIQLRIACRVRIHCRGPVHDKAWEEKSETSRHYYKVVQTPGEPLDDPENAEFDAEMADSGKANFAVLELDISGFEWLYISDNGHRRARFDWTGKEWQGTWLVP